MTAYEPTGDAPDEADAPEENVLATMLTAQLQALTSELGQRDFSETVDDVALFARRNPLLFLGGAALAGFALARVLKAGRAPDVDEHDDPWQGYLDDGTQEAGD